MTQPGLLVINVSQPDSATQASLRSSMPAPTSGAASDVSPPESAADVRLLKRLASLTSQAFNEPVDPGAGIVAIRSLAESMRRPGIAAAVTQAAVGQSPGTLQPVGEVVDAPADCGRPDFAIQDRP